MTSKDALILIDEIKKSKKLPKWDGDFVASISIQAKQGRKLSLLQSNKLQEVYRRSQKI